MIQIDKGIAIPVFGRRGRTSQYPWEAMEVGDSFFVRNRTAANFRSTCEKASVRHKPKKFICRDVEGGVRAWRIA